MTDKFCDTCKHFPDCDYSMEMLSPERQNDECESWEVFTKTVYIPAYEQHNGVYGMYVTIPWICPVCEEIRGEPFKTKSYDGSRILYCDGWLNPCGHVDKYKDVRNEFNTITV